MHSSKLRDSDFQIINGKQIISPAKYFNGFTNTKRLGLLTPNGIEGIGAITLVMAYITAFYNTYRASGNKFFAYPDYYTFQSRVPKATYGMFDIWPDHKSVIVGTDPIDSLNAITDSAINILFFPVNSPTPRNYQPQQKASATRLIDTCYLYSPDGKITNSDFSIRCNLILFNDWIENLFDSIPHGKDAFIKWKSTHDQEQIIEQSFRRITLEKALSLI